ncbi:hypothetical protein Bca4012_001349 [Brassica carinata]
MEFLETLGCIWSSKEVIRVIFGRALPGATRATYRSDAMNTPPIRRSDLPERQGEVAPAPPGRSRRNDPGATSRSDVPRIVSRLKVDSLIDHLPSLVRYLITQGLIPMPMSSLFP